MSGRDAVREFRELVYRCELKQSEVAWLCGVNVRQVRAWSTGEYPVPQYARLLLVAYRDGLISPRWLVKVIGSDPP